MIEEDVEELVALCASILDDGEVTSEEAYQLADWLNNHDEAAEHWPGNQLIEPLRDVWADGTANSRDLHRLARLLISVQRAWARRPQTAITLISSHVSPRISTDKIDDVRLPTLHGRFRVPSQSEPGLSYEVDLDRPTCNCPDWRNRRSRLPQGDLTRCCKHILHILARLVDPAVTDNWLVAFIENGWPSHPGAQWHLLDHNGTKALFCTASEQGWANIFAMQGERYERFGFNTLEGRWAYGIEPEGSASIESAISNCETDGESVGNSQSAVGGVLLRPDAPRVCDQVWTHRVPPSALPQSSDNEPVRRRFRWTPLMGCVGILLAAAFFVTKRETRPARTAADSATPTGVTAAVSPSPSSSATIIRSTPKPVPRQASVAVTSSPAWTVVTRQDVKAKASRGQTVIPRGTKLRVVARSQRELMISYKGESLTIPATAVTSPP
ncbi:MAG: hypothetical protein QOH39_4 [Verrucomicrobiota bacterium]|jgi:hypothetical protein